MHVWASSATPALLVNVSVSFVHVLVLGCRDFAYVARDKNTRVLKCHVFRCDTPAAAIATSLHEICSKVSPIGVLSCAPEVW